MNFNKKANPVHQAFAKNVNKTYRNMVNLLPVSIVTLLLLLSVVNAIDVMTVIDVLDHQNLVNNASKNVRLIETKEKNWTENCSVGCAPCHTNELWCVPNNLIQPDIGE